MDAEHQHDPSLTSPGITSPGITSPGITSAPPEAESGSTPALTVAFVRGVVPAKWFRVWGERFPAQRLASFRSEQREQVAVLHDGRADVSLVRLPDELAGLHSVPLYEERPFVVAPKGHELEALDEVRLADLVGLALLHNRDAHPAWPAATVQLDPALPPGHTIEDVLALVVAGVGVVLVPQSVARLHHRGDVISRPVVDAAPTQICLTWAVADDRELIQEFVGVVRGRTARSSRGAGDGAGKISGGSGAGKSKSSRAGKNSGAGKSKSRGAEKSSGGAAGKSSGSANGASKSNGARRQQNSKGTVGRSGRPARGKRNRPKR